MNRSLLFVLERVEEYVEEKVCKLIFTFIGIYICGRVVIFVEVWEGFFDYSKYI